MSRKTTHTHTSVLSVELWSGRSADLGLEIDYMVTPARPATRFEPAEPEAAEYIAKRLTWDGDEVPIPDWLDALIESDDDLRAAVLDDYHELMGAMADEAADARFEMMREARHG